MELDIKKGGGGRGAEGEGVVKEAAGVSKEGFPGMVVI